MSFTGPDRQRDGEGELDAPRRGLGVPKRTRVLVGLVLLVATFWAGWWVRGKVGDRTAAAPETRGAATTASEVAVVTETLAPMAADAGAASDASRPVPPAADAASPSPAPTGAPPSAASAASAAPDAGPAGPSVANTPAPTERPARRLDFDDAEPPAPPPRMTWSVDRDGIQGAVREALPDIRECYEAWLRANPALTGKVTVRFTIDKDPADAEHGKVVQAALVSSTMEHPLMEGCVLNVMSGLAFEAPEGGQPLVVNYPFVLRTEP